MQLFTRDGKFITQWPELERPSGLFMDRQGNFFVPELGAVATFPGIEYPPLSPTAHVRVLSHKGKTLAMLGAALDMSQCCAPGYFCAPYACYVDADDSLYVGEPLTGQIKAGRVPPGCHVIRKFVRIK